MFLSLIQVAWLFLAVIGLTLFLLGWIKLNYKLSALNIYFPLMCLLGVILSYMGKNLLFLDPGTNFFLYLLPILGSLFFQYSLKGKYKSAIYFSAPAFVILIVLFMYPLIFQIYLAFHRLNLTTLSAWIHKGEIGWVGFENFKEVFFPHSELQEPFLSILLRTCLWTFVNVFFHVVVGTFLAFLLNQKIKGVSWYRTLLVIPWALPQLIAVLAWKGEFHSSFGYVNKILQMVHIPPQEWLTQPDALFFAMCFINIWLGIPFMMVVALGGLQSIPKSYYEAASIDGASKFQKFFYITIPLLRPVMLPSIILGAIWTFNNVNVVYLMTSQKGSGEGVDILVSDLYKQAFQYNRYSFSAAYSLVIFFLLTLLTLFWIKSTKVARDPLR